MALVSEIPVSVSFKRSSLITDSAGGFTESAPVVLPPQDVRLIPAGSTSNVIGGQPRTTPEGQTYNPAYALIGAIDLDVQIGDKFTLDGQTYAIMDITVPRHWRTRAEVARWAG